MAIIHRQQLNFSLKHWVVAPQAQASPADTQFDGGPFTPCFPNVLRNSGKKLYLTGTAWKASKFLLVHTLLYILKFQIPLLAFKRKR